MNQSLLKNQNPGRGGMSHYWRHSVSKFVCFSVQGLVLLFGPNVYAQGFSVVPNAAPSLNDVVITSQISQRRNAPSTTFAMHLSCYNVNLRGVANPVNPNGLIQIDVGYRQTTAGYGLVSLAVPGWRTHPTYDGYTTPSPLAPFGSSVLPETSQAYVSGRWVVMTLPNFQTFEINSDTGNVDKNEMFSAITSVNFYQRLNPAYAGEYLGYEGPLSANVTWHTASSGKAVSLAASIPGSNGFCGGYFSPLMLFKDEKRPRFSALTDFKLIPNLDFRWYWPEARAPGHFLAIDSNHNGLIDDGDELFTDGHKFTNGFQALARLDSNKDGVIDEQDEKFDQLLLWQDRNADGVSQRSELISAKAYGLLSVALKYQRIKRNFGHGAQSRQESVFTYREPGNRGIKKGEVLDLWFQAIPKQLLADIGSKID